MKKTYKIIGIIVIILIIISVLILLTVSHYSNYKKKEEAKTKTKVHRVLKQKGWENKIKTEEPIFTFNTGDNYLEVTYKEEPYNTYQYYYDLDDDGKVTGEAVLKEKYQRYDLNKNKYKEYRKRHHFEEKYDLK
ncbi:DUF3139 domain-containing protein [Staphylococcus sp. HMSC62A08]|uniref:DUF3139 domain-containing protein n=1 Tax=Staphylococcus sp. HMSC62A08 TaxID=1608883 RepID=UPI0008A99FD3|nr:DUF3139 domain-containing protein [Staphylococcus sp. HMSC62A08]OHS41584.1 hypothetical protein HMPREF3264_00790 [Staphylococcus sp. HMSC62A08]